MKTYPPAEYLNECFSYNPETGQFFYKERPKSHFKTAKAWAVFCKKRAGKAVAMKPSFEDGYRKALAIRVQWQGKSRIMIAHRLAFILMGVVIPPGMQVDHKDCDRHNNAWTNLRLATQSQNLGNQMVHVKRKFKLPKGVYMHHCGKYRAQIRFNKKTIWLGLFEDQAEANKAYAAKAKELYGEFARSN